MCRLAGERAARNYLRFFALPFAFFFVIGFLTGFFAVFFATFRAGFFAVFLAARFVALFAATLRTFLAVRAGRVVFVDFLFAVGVALRPAVLRSLDIMPFVKMWLQCRPPALRISHGPHTSWNRS